MRVMKKYLRLNEADNPTEKVFDLILVFCITQSIRKLKLSDYKLLFISFSVEMK